MRVKNQGENQRKGGEETFETLSKRKVIGRKKEVLWNLRNKSVETAPIRFKRNDLWIWNLRVCKWEVLGGRERSLKEIKGNQ